MKGNKYRLVNFAEQVRSKLTKLTSDHLAKTDSIRPVSNGSPRTRQSQKGMTAGSLRATDRESLQRISGNSPSKLTAGDVDQVQASQEGPMGTVEPEDQNAMS